MRQPSEIYLTKQRAFDAYLPIAEIGRITITRTYQGRCTPRTGNSRMNWLYSCKDTGNGKAKSQDGTRRCFKIDRTGCAQGSLARKFVLQDRVEGSHPKIKTEFTGRGCPWDHGRSIRFTAFPQLWDGRFSVFPL